jgi:plasmid stability protein
MPRRQAAAPEADEMRRVMVRLPDEVHHAIKVSAAFQRLTMEEAIRDVLTQHRWPGVQPPRRERAA